MEKHFLKINDASRSSSSKASGPKTRTINKTWTWYMYTMKPFSPFHRSERRRKAPCNGCGQLNQQQINLPVLPDPVLFHFGKRSCWRTTTYLTALSVPEQSIARSRILWMILSILHGSWHGAGPHHLLTVPQNYAHLPLRCQ